MNIIITEEEYRAMSDLRLDAIAVFLSLKVYVDYATGISGKEKRHSIKGLCEATTHYGTGGKRIETSPDCMKKRVIPALVRSGLVVDHGNLIFSFPLSQGVDPSKIKCPQSVTEVSPKKSPELSPVNAIKNAGFGGKTTPEESPTKTAADAGNDPTSFKALSCLSNLSAEKNVHKMAIPTPAHLKHLYGPTVDMDTAYEAFELLCDIDEFWHNKRSEWGESAEAKIRQKIMGCLTKSWVMNGDKGVIQALNLYATQRWPEAFAAQPEVEQQKQTGTHNGRAKRSGTTLAEMESLRQELENVEC